MRRYAVLMGDLVDSETAPSAAALHKTFNSAIARQNQTWKKVIASPLTITLGDEFQGLVRSFNDALSILRDLRLDLLEKEVDCRFALGTVELDTPLNSRRAWNMMGSGLARTRDKLNERDAEGRYRFVLPEHEEIEPLVDALGVGLTVIERRWTNRQLEVTRALLSGSTPSDIARAKKVTVFNIYKIRSAADYHAYASHWQTLERTFKSLDSQYGMAA